MAGESKDVKAVYERAVASPGPDASLPAAQRSKLERAFEQEL
jgi:hypothetical protein